MRKRHFFCYKGYTFIEMILVTVMIPLIAFAVYKSFTNVVNFMLHLGGGSEDDDGEAAMYVIFRPYLPDFFLRLQQDLENSNVFWEDFNIKFILTENPDEEEEEVNILLAFQALLPGEDRTSGESCPGFVVYMFANSHAVAVRFQIRYDQWPPQMDEGWPMEMLAFAQNFHVQHYSFDDESGGYVWGEPSPPVDEMPSFENLETAAVRITAEFPDQNITRTFWRRAEEHGYY